MALRNILIAYLVLKQMAGNKREKLTLAFNQYEAERLNTLQFSYMFGRAWYSLVPSVNEILRGLVLYTLFETRHRGKLRSLSNGFLKKRNLPPSSDNQDNEDKEWDAEYPASLRFVRDVKLENTNKFITPKKGNYSFYFEKMDIANITELKERVSSFSGLSISDLSNPEVVRECIHFVLDKDDRDLDFRYLTYIGYLYGMQPVVSVIIGRSERRGEKREDVLRLISAYIEEKDTEQFISVITSAEDRKTYKKFEKEYLQYWRLDRIENVNRLFGKYRSKNWNFDFYLAFIGSEMLWFASRPYVKEISDVAVYLMINHNKDLAKELLGFFGDYLNSFYNASAFLDNFLASGPNFDLKKYLSEHESEILDLIEDADSGKSEIGSYRRENSDKES